MKKADLVNEVAKTALTKKEAATAIEIIFEYDKNDFKKERQVFPFWFWKF